MQMLSRLVFIANKLPLLYKRPDQQILSRYARQNRVKKHNGGMELAPFVKAESEINGNTKAALFKSTIFTASFCFTAFSYAAIYHHEHFIASTNSIMKWVQREWTELEGWDHKEFNIRKEFNKWWNELPDGKKVFWSIFLINFCVFLAWRSKQFQPFMYRYFCSNPFSRIVCWPMFFSTFSHFSLFHLGINMYVLHSFSAAVCNMLNTEQLIALYTAGGVVSSLSSYFVKVIRSCPGPSLGASGAIMVLLGYFCISNPDANLGIVFIPGFTFSAAAAIKSIMCLDFLGIVLGWRIFDHGAHLGGALFGVFYAYYGQKYIWSQRNLLIDKWERLKDWQKGSGKS